jgi:sulfur-oxidizing protein SoxA
MLKNKIKIFCVTIAALSVGTLSVSTIYAAESESFKDEVKNDIESFQNFYTKKFPNTDYADFSNGIYSIDAASREQWEEIEEFAPYELSIEDGEALYTVAFANGKFYADCFENAGINIAKNYPYFDVQRKEIITLELAINECRQANGEPALKYKTGDLANISAYISYSSRGEIMNVDVPNEEAYKAYLSGKKFFYSKRGQLNFSCADCHMKLSNQLLRADIVGPALGHTTGFPTYRSKWDSLGTLHRRYAGCNKNIRALPFAAQSHEYRELEYFQSIMNTGLKRNAPSTRK